jgi:hypothetical protein
VQNTPSNVLKRFGSAAKGPYITYIQRFSGRKLATLEKYVSVTHWGMKNKLCPVSTGLGSASI